MYYVCIYQIKNKKKCRRESKNFICLDNSLNERKFHVILLYVHICARVIKIGKYNTIKYKEKKKIYLFLYPLMFCYVIYAI